MPRIATQMASQGPGAAAHADDWLQIDWHRHQRWVQLPGGPVNVVDLGSGPAVLFVHGLGGRWTNWIEQLPTISAGWRTIAVDLPGFGASPMPAEPISIAGYARTLARLLDALRIDSATLVGNSMGGETAVELALRWPERVDRLALVSPAGISTALAQQQMRMLRRVHPAVQMVTRLVAADAQWLARRPRIRGAMLSVVAAHPRQLPPPLAFEQLKGVGKPGFLPALEAIASHSRTLRERLPAVAAPTLLLWGAQDPVIPVRDVDVFERKIPGAHKIVWQHTGHVAMFERPAEFNALLEGFLSG